MSTNTPTDTFDSGIGVLASDRGPAAEVQENNPIAVSGVALPVNTTVQGGQGEPHFFPPETLERGADLLEGANIVKNFHEIEGQAPADDVIGEVTDAAFSEGVGLVYQGEIIDDDIAQAVERGYLDVSPTIARSLGALDETMGAREVNQIQGFRDLAVVQDGQPGAGIDVGPNPAVAALQRDVLSRAFDTMQEGVPEGVDTVPPEAAQENAQMALDAREETGNPNDCGTDVGWRRANQLADGEALSRDTISRMSQFARHEENSDMGDEGRSDCGWMMWKAWGGDEGVDWAQRKLEEIDSKRDTMQRDRARTPVYNGTEERSWGDVDTALEDYVAGYDSISGDVETVDDLSDEEKSLIASKTLLGEVDGETTRELIFFPVVNPDTDSLNRGALNAVRGGRGSAADIPNDALASAQRMAGELLNEEFDAEVDVNTEHRVDETDTMSVDKAKETLAEEHGLDAEQIDEAIDALTSDDEAESETDARTVRLVEA